MRTARIHTVAAAAVALTMLAACSSDKGDAETVAPAAAATTSATPSSSSGAADGPGQTVGDGKAWTYVLSDSAGKPTEVGVRMSGASLSGLAADAGGMHPVPMVLSFPTGADSGVLNHVEMYWNPQGHEPPGVWDKPHFDFHFYLTDAAAVAQIVPTATDFATKAAHLPDAKYIPADFARPPGTAVDNTIPGMGLHWSDKTEPPIPGHYTFTETMINGSYDGAMTFIEPMITRDWLLTKPSLSEPLKAPAAYQHTGLYPTTYFVRYDAAKDEYTIGLGGFTQRTAS